MFHKGGLEIWLFPQMRTLRHWVERDNYWVSLWMVDRTPCLINIWHLHGCLSGTPLSATVKKLNLGEEKLAEISLLLPSRLRNRFCRSSVWEWESQKIWVCLSSAIGGPEPSQGWGSRVFNSSIEGLGKSNLGGYCPCGGEGLDWGLDSSNCNDKLWWGFLIFGRGRKGMFSQ